MPSPFQLFSWDKPFLPALVDLVDTLTHSAPQHALIVVPHNRPRRYLTELYREQAVAKGRPCLLPRVLTVQECIALLRGHMSGHSLYEANMLDRVAVLYACVQELAQHDAQLCSRFAAMDIPRFLPWGLRLGALFEDCFTQNIPVADLSYTEGEVAAVAAALLNALGRLQKAYVQGLHERGWTTSGLDAFSVAQALDAATTTTENGTVDYDQILPPQLCPTAPLGKESCGSRPATRVVLLAGFGVLSGTEESIFRHLWHAGAHVCLHTDCSIADGQEHWACRDHAQWLRGWRADSKILVPTHSPQQEPTIHFVAGYDVHSQLLAVRDMLGSDAKGELPPPSTAIVLADSALLMPTLHTLPDKGVNISMGYPLERTPLCRLIETIMQVQAHRQEDGRYHWRSLRHCMRHPYLQLLTVRQPLEEGEQSTQQGSSQSLRGVLLRIEALLRQGSRFVDVDALEKKALELQGVAPENPMATLTGKVLTAVLKNFAAVRTPADMGGAIADLCVLLLEYGEHIWERYPLDAESMFRLRHDVVPTLQNSALAQTAFPLPALQALVRQAIQAGRVPFEADPIAGMQVLGMLETRLLHFDRVVIVDATDDNLPGASSQDPLLPDSLRVIVGLPDARRRDRTVAHNLYRLLRSAKDVWFYWQEGVQHSALFDGKKSRSRFVDALLWQQEQARGALLQAGEPPLESTPCRVRPMSRSRKALPNSAALRQRMAQLLAGELSPTRLDLYMGCPLRFAYRHLCRIQTVQEVNEGDDPAAVGALVHRVLQAAYTPYLHKDVHSGDISGPLLNQCFAEHLHASALGSQLPPDSYYMLELAGPVRLSRYADNQPVPTHIVALERKLTAQITVGTASYSLQGTVDRVDKREGALVVLDYKTGSVSIPAPSLWSDSDFWQSLNCYFTGKNASLAGTGAAVSDPLLTLREKVCSLQLPCYVYLLGHTEDLRPYGPVGDAALVRLQTDGQECLLFGDNLDEASKQRVMDEYIPTLLGFVVQHMAFTDEFFPIEGAHCEWCEYAGICLK